MRRALSHLVQQGASLAWGSWREMVVLRAAKRLALRHALSFMLDGCLARGFASWKACVFRALPESVSRAVSHLVHRELAFGWGSWRFIIEVRDVEANLERSVRSFRMVCGMTAWAAAMERGIRTESQFTAAQRAVRRLQHQQLARALSTW
eukprot:174858-Prymnesium_polylepis.1